jgi:uncharacterized protein (TIGR00730 family)
MLRSVCVFCSSSNALDPVFFESATALGHALAARDLALVYGGTNVGLMGRLADTVKAAGGKVVGIIPEAIAQKGLSHFGLDELHVTKDLRARKSMMESRADAFIALPGGFGTLEESLEILTLKQLHLTTKPLIFVNTRDYFAPLVAMFEHIYREKFSKPASRELYHVARDVPDAMAHLEGYRAPVNVEGKWY